MVNIGSSNGLSKFMHDAITLTNADLLSIAPLGTNYFNQNRKLF